MSFKDIQLPDILLADLYKSDIVVLEGNTSTPKKVKKEAAVQPVKNYLGNNQKNVCVLVNDDANIHIDDESLAFLTSVLGACKLTIADVAIVNLANTTTDVTTLAETLKPVQCIMFNVTTQQINLPFTIPLYQVQNFNNCKYVMAPATQIFINKDDYAVSEKRKLWASLKNMFNI